MNQIPKELRYAPTHEWVLVEEDGTVTVGITYHAQDLLGDVVFVELPEVGAELAAASEAGVVESVKAASDIYAPISGTVIEVNENLQDTPELVNSDPYHDGWFFRMKPADMSELDELLDAAGYKEVCEEDEH
jgi:glycine cleavage system H protein